MSSLKHSFFMGTLKSAEFFCIAQWRPGHTSRRSIVIRCLAWGSSPSQWRASVPISSPGLSVFWAPNRVLAVDQKAPATLNVLMQKRGKQAAIDALLPAGRGLAN
jgi:hypothetical protein